MYSQGISTRDIQKTMQEMYGIDVNDSRVSKITDKGIAIGAGMAGAAIAERLRHTDAGRDSLLRAG